jgi:pyruvate/2-oxoglutarate dehydrogenase complex dihydrolipoamide acyltransferase (E2) component
MSTEYQLPQLPLGGAPATIVCWLKQPGDQLAPGDPLLVVVNDRAEFALPVPAAGILDTQLAAEGAAVVVGAPLARISVDQPAAVAQQEQPAAPPALAVPRHASPVARRIAEKTETDITNLVGSGPGGRILKRDILAQLDDRPQIQNPKSKIQNLSTPTPMRRAIAEHMLRSRATSPHALTAMEVDMGRVAAARARMREAFARRGVDLTYTVCIALAAIEALLRHPLLNSSWSDAGIILRRRIHLGVAVALPDGLITPVVREAQDLNLRGLARAVADVSRRARAQALEPGEASGGTFTITNPGAGALWFGTPIIPQPQSAILGVGAIGARPLVVSVGDADRIVVRPATVLTLAYDARVLDQCHADAFLRDVKGRLEHFEV